MLYPQNGDRIVTIDSVTSLHTVYTGTQYCDVYVRLSVCVLRVSVFVRELISEITRPIFTKFYASWLSCCLGSVLGVAIRYVFPVSYNWLGAYG